MEYAQKFIVRSVLLMLLSISGLHGSWIQDYDNTILVRMPLRQAIIDGDFDKVQKIVKDPDFNVNRITNFGASYLQEAIKYHRDEIVDYLLEHGADYDFGYSQNGPMHPLFNAVLGTNVAAVKSLVNAGADLEPEYEKLTPLDYAVKMYEKSNSATHQSEYKDDLIQIMQILLHVDAYDAHDKAKIIVRDYYYPLFRAVLDRDVNAVKGLIADGVSVHDLYGKFTPLMYAVKMYKTANDSEYKDDLIQIMQILLHAGADDSQEVVKTIIDDYYASLAPTDSPFSTDIDSFSDSPSVLRYPWSSPTPTSFYGGSSIRENYYDHSPSSFNMSVESDDMTDKDYYQR